uniref:Putative secreted protein n=1 Tax=Anopheles darlingi TaxID=43151 RepID=A0A2M4D7D6_ANODA
MNLITRICLPALLPLPLLASDEATGEESRREASVEEVVLLLPDVVRDTMLGVGLNVDRLYRWYSSAPHSAELRRFET